MLLIRLGSMGGAWVLCGWLALSNAAVRDAAVRDAAVRDTAPGNAAVRQTQLRQLAQPYIDAGHVVGMTIGVVHQGQRSVAGVGRLGVHDPRTPDGDTVYEIGSVTKVLTGLLLADAVVQGRFDLQTSLADVGVAMKSGAEAITLRHLATHTSGLPPLPDNLKIQDASNPYRHYAPVDLTRYLATAEPLTEPGSCIEYSTLGVGLLGRVLTGQIDGHDGAYAELLADRLTGPLKLPDTSARPNKPAWAGRRAVPHDAGGQEVAHWDVRTLNGAGAVKSTVSDMLRLIELHLNPAEAGPWASAIESAWRVHQPPIKPGDLAMGLGWFIAQDGQTRWHHGQTGGFYAIVLINRRLDLGVVILANTATGQVEALANDVFKAALGIPVQPRVVQQKASVSTEAMDRLVGEYRLGNRFVFTVTRRGDRLFVQLTGQPTLLLEPQSPTRWTYRDVPDAALRFEIDDDGSVTSLTLLQHGIEQTARRIK